MSNISEQMAVAYLLGELSEEETLRLDEMSIRDDVFAKSLKDVENDLVDQYVRGELSGNVLASFKSHYLASPRRREKVKFAESLVQMVDKPSSKVSSAKLLEFEPRSSSMHPFFQWTFAAAALLLMFGAGYLLFENYNLRNEISRAKNEQSTLKMREQELERELAKQHSLDREKTQELAQIRERLKQLEQQVFRKPEEPRLIAFNLAPQTRGISRIRTLEIPRGFESVVFNLDVESNDFSSYRVTLKSSNSEEVVWRSETIKADAKNLVKVTIPSTLLKSQDYVFQLSGLTADGSAEIVSTYVFRLKK